MQPQGSSCASRLSVQGLAWKIAGHCEFYKQYTKFTYPSRLIPLPNRSKSWSARHYNGDLHDPFNPNFVQYSIRSFNDAPNFEQYVHYHFAIDNTSNKLFHICGMLEINFQRDFPFLQLDEGSPTGTIMVILLHNSCVASTLASERGTPRNTVFE